MVSRLGLVVLNVGNTTTFRRANYTQTIIDVSFASEGLSTRVNNWHVMEDFTASDHQYISFEIQHEQQPPGEAHRPKPNIKIKFTLSIHKNKYTLILKQIII